MDKKAYLLLTAVLSVLIISSLVSSCKYDNVEELSPKCDTSSVTYSGTVVPILQTNCYGCHGTNSNSGSGGINLQDYNVLKTFAADSQLVGNIEHLPGYNPMPYGGEKLSDCEIAKIKKWVANGYPNN